MDSSTHIIIVSCEHATAYVPERWQGCFVNNQQVLETHRGYDPGALSIAMPLARKHRASLYCGEISRLLIDLNRSPQSATLFSEFTTGLPQSEKQYLLEAYYERYRKQVCYAVMQAIQAGFTVIHLSVHSFTPVLNGEERNFEIGLLYDPERASETSYMRQWESQLQRIDRACPMGAIV